jgi:hypothetical protein
MCIELDVGDIGNLNVSWLDTLSANSQEDQPSDNNANEFVGQ